MTVSIQLLSIIFNLFIFIVNSQCTFDEFMAIRKSDFLYKCKYDGFTIYENQLNDLNLNNPKHYNKNPENYVETEDFL